MSRLLIIFLLIIGVGFALRFYQLGNVPVGFHRDEAFLGYNAYSLLKTGHDMSGHFLPIHLEDFLYSPAGYSYVTIPFVWLFGLNEFAVRFASALLGSLTVIVTYFLVQEVFSYRKTFSTSTRNYIKTFALLTSFFLAVSPWHINLSRVATENVLVVFLISIGVLLYLQWVRKQRLWLILVSFLAFGLTLLMYQAPRAFLPLFLPLLFVCFYPKVWKKHLWTQAILFLVIIIIPVLMILSSHDLTQRIRMLSIFQNSATQLVLDEQIREDVGNSPAETRFFHNKVSNYSITFFRNYFSHFSYDFLLLDTGFPDRYRVPQMGLLYFFELPLLIFGIWRLFAREKRIALFLSGWILLAPLGSAFTYDDIPNLQRTLIIFPALSIVIAYGFLQLWSLLSGRKAFRVGQAALLVIMLYGLVYYFHQYYVHQVNHQPWRRQEGYKELVAQVTDLKSSYKKVVITDAESAPAIFFLFYEEYEPKKVQQQLLSHPTDVSGRMPLENYEFPEIPCPLDIKAAGEKDILYVNSGNCKKLPAKASVISEIKRSDGTVVFRLYKL